MLTRVFIECLRQPSGGPRAITWLHRRLVGRAAPHTASPREAFAQIMAVCVSRCCAKGHRLSGFTDTVFALLFGCWQDSSGPWANLAAAPGLPPPGGSREEAPSWPSQHLLVPCLLSLAGGPPPSAGPAWLPLPVPGSQAPIPFSCSPFWFLAC